MGFRNTATPYLNKLLKMASAIITIFSFGTLFLIITIFFTIAELRLLPRHNITINDVMGYGDASGILEQFALWKDERDKKLFSA